jgi:hypothetical protein
VIYTIGNIENYILAMAMNGKVFKQGKRTDSDGTNAYPGGYAFLTYEDAQRRITEEGKVGKWGVFGLNANWETDTEPATDGWWHNLKIDAEIVILPQMMPDMFDIIRRLNERIAELIQQSNTLYRQLRSFTGEIT